MSRIHICGRHQTDPGVDEFDAQTVDFEIPPGTKTFEIAFALVVQDVPKSIDGSLFLIDDAMVIAQYP